ncbi:Protein SAR DEFICIENT 1 [Carex littledalei]|uniref:Protein SAR DEFICIENT 1 n=1 Tax=Carex littledalei TaxID=544730 RepID=A0A833RWT7_9POAL|nr:Protein SAR DEFICIENT 1 [Carex littledalei]
MENGRKFPWEELEQDDNQNQLQSGTLPNPMPEFQPRNMVHDMLFQLQIMRFSVFRNRQYYIEEAVPTPQSQPLHSEDLPRHKLVFANQVPQSIYTGNKITDNNNEPIQIQLIDINTGKECTNMEGLNIKVKIVVIDGDLELEGLDSDKFSSKIVKPREGRRPLLLGNTEVTLNQQGVGTIGEICFTDNSKWLRSGKFRLGACP